MKEDNKESLLIIDKDPDSLRLYELIFRDLYILKFADNHQTAKKIIESNKTKVVIADSVQYFGSIVDCFSELKVDFPFLKFLIVTNFRDSQFVENAINKAGVYSFFTKPVEPHRIIVAVEKAIEQYNLESKQKELISSLQEKNDAYQLLLQRLSKEEKKFRTLYESRTEPTFIVCKKGRLLACNNAGQKFISNNSSLNKSFHFCLIEEIRKTFDDYLSVIGEAKSHKQQPVEFSINKEIYYFEINHVELQYDEQESFMIWLNDVSLQKEMEKKVLQSIIQTEEKERRRFSQELHDGIGPLLSTTKLYLQWFSRPDSKADKSVIISKAEETLEETIASLREISNNISPNVLLNFGLNTALKAFIDRIKAVSNINILYSNTVLERLNNEVEVTIYRLVGECVNNTIKHAKASEVSVQIDKSGDLLQVTYKDNGIGFNVEQGLSEIKGNGLVNMQSRVLSLGGSLNIESGINQGTKLTLNIKA
ncbi:ATP-binding protein [Carboxylicivirga sp. M1479]|uniref:ATP-binding protein n=1 Tax=Carboxylicivirga sp. M1479 TaxID=2594476 RepID=UPI0011787BD5|nr:ATP-binding protein [Carboxylicivirga sp. M1479]TRX72055.1 response regulator [Carboxylicivirga sp. M1479]